MAVRTAGQLRPVNSTICITPYCFLCNRITCLRRSCSSARLCLRASSSLIGKVMNCVATTIKISLGRVYNGEQLRLKHHLAHPRPPPYEQPPTQLRYAPEVVSVYTDGIDKFLLPIDQYIYDD